MANSCRHIDLAVCEAMETQDAAGALQDVIAEALADGVVTPEEALRIRDHAATVYREASEVVTAVERANVAELLIVSIIRDGKPSPKLLVRARDVGLDVAYPLLVPMDQAHGIRQAA